MSLRPDKVDIQILAHVRRALMNLYTIEERSRILNGYLPSGHLTPHSTEKEQTQALIQILGSLKGHHLLARISMEQDKNDALAQRSERLVHHGNGPKEVVGSIPTGIFNSVSGN